jgi:outer membrane autotransporter protein
VGRDYQAGATTLTPHVLAAYTHYSAEDYIEEGAGGANLDVASDTMDILEFGVGLTAGWEHKTEGGGVLKPELRAEYRYDVIGDSIATSSRFTGGGAAFKTEGFDPAQHRFNIGTGLTYTTPGNWELKAAYDYELKEDFSAHSGLLKASYKF